MDISTQQGAGGAAARSNRSRVASRLRATVAVAATVTAFVGVPDAMPAAPVTLAGTNVLKASRPVSLDVRVPRTVTVATPFAGSPDLDVTGSGRLMAFVLTGAEARNRTVTIAGGAIGAMEPRRFLLPLRHSGLSTGSYEVYKTYADTTEIPAGAYRLYLIPDGGPTQITLRLRGLSGRVTLAPSRRATAEVAPGDAWGATAQAGPNAFAGAVARRLDARGLGLHVLRAQLEGEAAWELVMCHDNPSAVPAEELRGAPGCPAGDDHVFVDNRLPDLNADAKLFVQGWANLSAGEHGLSGVFTSQARAVSVDYVTLWLTY